MVNLIVCILFLAIGIPIIVYYRKKFISKTDDLIFYSNEKVIYGEFPVKCYLKQRKSQKTYMPNSKIEITNYRILISQKYLFSKKFLLTYVINYKNSGRDILKHLENEKFKNCMDVSPDDITFEHIKGKDFVNILLPENNILCMISRVTISFTTKNIEEIKTIINTKSVIGNR